MSKELIFQSIFGLPWDSLPPVMQRHYGIRSYTNDRVVVRGHMVIKRRRLMKLMAPMLRIFGALVPFDGKDIPTTVTFYSAPRSSDFHFDRVLQPEGRPPLRFHSCLVQISGNDVIELMRFGFGWRSHFSIEGNRVLLRHNGYYWRIAKWLIPLPLAWIIGKGEAAEEVVSDTGFKMWMAITHPVFGEVYRYEGTFEIAEVTYG